MSLTVQATGTQSATVNTEHKLVDANTTAGVWGFAVNTKNMAAGEELELPIYVKKLTGDTKPPPLHCAGYSGKQGDAAAPASSVLGEVIKVSPPIDSPYAVTFTLKQTAGTGRNFDWRAV